MTRPGYSILVCADPELIRDRVAELLAGQSFVARTFWGDEDLPDRYWQTLTVPSMMGPPNAVVLRRAEGRDEEFWSRLDPVLAMARPSIWPMFCFEAEWSRGKPGPPKVATTRRFWAAAQKRGWIWEHPGLTRTNIGQELDRFASRHGLTFAPGVKKKLAESLPLTAIALRGELAKIRLLAGDEQIIRPGHLGALDVLAPFDIFAFLRQMQTSQGRTQAWDRLLNDPAMASGDMLFPVVALLVREARILWQLAHGDDGKVQLHPGIKSDKKRLAERLGPARIARFWDLALRADTDIKTGRLRPAQAMEILIRDAQGLW